MNLFWFSLIGHGISYLADYFVVQYWTAPKAFKNALLLRHWHWDHAVVYTVCLTAGKMHLIWSNIQTKDYISQTLQNSIIIQTSAPFSLTQFLRTSPPPRTMAGTQVQNTLSSCWAVKCHCLVGTICPLHLIKFTLWRCWCGGWDDDAQRATDCGVHTLRLGLTWLRPSQRRDGDWGWSHTTCVLNFFCFLFFCFLRAANLTLSPSLHSPPPPPPLPLSFTEVEQWMPYYVSCIHSRDIH